MEDKVLAGCITLKSGVVNNRKNTQMFILHSVRTTFSRTIQYSYTHINMCMCTHTKRETKVEREREFVMV